ncbi:hypothetical protein BKA70DRAFT_1424581 [Coprinopsis sp. MPI-PUGE-AT-0042]|nr:hypothetical protein BKA70DRAFT_1424581 [Coprinopsis sp. MPI-PUGE-AT-0042]
MAFPTDPSAIPTFNAGHLPPRLEFVAYPLGRNSRPVPPAELEDYCYDHRFWLPLCFHDTATKVEIQEMENDVHSIYLRCARAVEQRCQYKLDLIALVSSPTLVTAPEDFAEDDDSMRSFIMSDSDMGNSSDSMSTDSDSEWSSTSTTDFSATDSDISALEFSEGNSLDSVLIFDANMEPRGHDESLDIIDRRILMDITNQEIHAAARCYFTSPGAYG